VKAAFITQTGPPENITYGDFPDLPAPTGAQVLVRVGAVAVNPIDTYVRSGTVAMKIPLPFIVGCDLAGTVAAVGPEERRFKVGERVWGTNQGLLGRQGTFAEFALVDECWLYPTPINVPDDQAAATALVGITAQLGLGPRAALQAGEILFVNGGTGGVGSTVVQMAKAIGARVITTAGTDAKVAECLKLGADLALNYQTQNVADAIKAFAPAGVNVWWETLREPNFELSVAALAPRGRMIVMAGREARPQFPLGPFYVKGCSLFGFAMFNSTPDEQRACSAEVNRWLAAGKLKARIDRVLPLSETAAAHRLQETNTIGKAGTLAGKIVLQP
jgi:NADPH2:quinone reductase